MILTALIIAGIGVYRQSHKTPASFYTSSEDFSIQTILFGFGKGEGDLFLGFIVAMTLFSLFIAGFVRWIHSTFL